MPSESAKTCIAISTTCPPTAKSSTRSCRSASTHCRPIPHRPPRSGRRSPTTTSWKACWRSRATTPGTRSVWNAQSFPACRSWSGASVTTSDATWLGAPSPVGATSPPTTPIGRCSKHGRTSSSRWRCASSRRALRCTATSPHSTCPRTISCNTRPTRECAGSAPSATPAAGRSPKSTSTTRPRSWRTPSPTRTGAPWQSPGER